MLLKFECLFSIFYFIPENCLLSYTKFFLTFASKSIFQSEQKNIIKNNPYLLASLNVVHLPTEMATKESTITQLYITNTAVQLN